MLEPSEVIMKLNGKTYTFSIQDRDKGVLETFDGVKTFIKIGNSAAGGLFNRGVYFGLYGGWQIVILGGLSSRRLSVAMEAGEAGAPLETEKPKIQVVEREGKLIVEGTPEQLAAAKKALAGI